MSWAAVGAIGGAVVGGLMNKRSNDASARASGAAADAANQQAEIARQQYADWTKDFLPLQGRIVDDANKVDSPQAYQRAAELSSGDVHQAFGNAKTDLTSRMASYGISPDNGRFATGLSRLELGEASADAGGQNAARQGVTDRGRAARLDAYSLGKGIPATAMSGLASATQGNLGVAGYNANLAARNSAGVGSLVQRAVPGIQDWWKSIGTGGTPYTGGPDPRSFDGN